MTQAAQDILGTQEANGTWNMFNEGHKAVFSSPSVAAVICPQNLILILSDIGHEAQWIGWDSRRQYIALI